MAMTEERQTSKGGNQNEPELDVSSSTVGCQETEPGSCQISHAEGVERNVPHQIVHIATRSSCSAMDRRGPAVALRLKYGSIMCIVKYVPISSVGVDQC